MTMYAMVAALLLAQAPPTPEGAPGAQGSPAAPPAAASERPRDEGRLPAPTPSRASAPPLLLEEALRESESKNLDLKATRARLEQARQLGAKAWSVYLPQVTATGSYTHFDVGATIDLPVGSAVRTRTGAPGTPGNPADPAGLPGADSPYFIGTQVVTVEVQRQNQLAAQIGVTQALLAPQAWYGIAAARLGELDAEQNTENGRRQVLFGTAQAYYNAAGLKQVVPIQERQLAIALEHERDARVRYEAGSSTKVTLLRAEIDRARAEQDLKRAQNAYLSAKVALATLLDRPTAEFEVVVPRPPDLPSDLDALERDAGRLRPDVQAAQTAVTLAEKNRDGVYARYAPVIGAFGRYQWSNVTGFTGKETAWAVGLQATWNLFDGGLREADLRDYQARVREADAVRLGAEARALDEVRRARLDLDSAVANREKAKEQLALAQENQRLVNVNYRAGAATYLEVSDANGALLSAELTQVSESLNADLAALRLLQAAGRFDPK